MDITRRSALLGLACAVTMGRASLALADAGTDRRFIVVILRGAMDGLTAVPPYGDPALAGLRAELLPPPPGSDKPGALLDLGGFYGLHPALAGLHGMYEQGDLLVAHATAGDWRSRSHFEAQDYLESGADHRLTSGWLNRVVSCLPRRPAAGASALAVGASTPLLLRGPAEIGTYAPQALPEPSVDLYARVAALNAHDRVIGPALTTGLHERGFTQSVLAGSEAPHDRGSFPALAGAAGTLLAAADGPRIAALEIGGWDTHAGQAGRIAGPLGQLDAGMVALRTSLGDAWRQTIVLVMTEFGRTVRMNGTKGTDHGTGTVAFALGGAVAGGKVRADWPGLAPDKLFEARDLQPTTDLRAFAKGLIGPHLGLDEHALLRVFPESQQAQALTGLLRA